jgi:hypothetical protein
VVDETGKPEFYRGTMGVTLHKYPELDNKYFLVIGGQVYTPKDAIRLSHWLRKAVTWIEWANAQEPPKE